MQRTLTSLVILAAVGCAGPGTKRTDSELLPPRDERVVQVAALVVDLETGETLLARDPKRLLRPASTMKVLTTAAICRRAPDAALETELVAEAAPADGVVLFGSGDPFLSTDEVRALAQTLSSFGAQRVERVRVVDPLRGAPRFGEGWMWDDEPDTFMPAISGAPVDGGCVTVEVEGTTAGSVARLVPVAGGLQVNVVERPGRAEVTRGRYTDAGIVTATGHVPVGDTVTRRLSVPDPADYTAWVVADALRRAGALADSAAVEVEAPSAATSQALQAAPHAASFLRPMAEIVARTNKDSDNLGAELLLRLLGTFAGEGAPLGPGSLADGLAALDADVRALGLDPAGYRIADGSGVSHYTLISAELLVKTLESMYHEGGRSFEVFERSLPVAGVDGTLASRMRGTPAEGRVHAKTGTISGVSNLAGYVTTASGRRLAFALLVQNFVGSARPWRDLQDAFCVRLAEL
ncbi:MAG: D-alanyl-D-alanine carboxypeptidase/D-alanyl-D-alanine-endopeptidase [Planctomycetota bacterium]